MNIFEIIVLSISLCADSFTCSVSKGICFKKITLKHVLFVAISFAVIQTLMPFIGYHIGLKISEVILKIGHILSFIILLLLGISLMKENEVEVNDSLLLKDIIILSISVSIDAASVGVTFSCLNTDIILPLISIFITTFITSVIGVILGHIVGNKYNHISKIIGGLILISIGIKILLFN